MNSRLKDLLAFTMLESQKYMGGSLSSYDNVNYNNSKKIISERIQFSLNYLKEQLGK